MGRPKGSTKGKKTIITREEIPQEEAAAPDGLDGAVDEFNGAFPKGKVVVWERVRDKPDSLIGTFEADNEVIARVAALVGGGDYVWKLRLPSGVWASKTKDGVPSYGKFTISERAFPKKTASQQSGAPAAAPPAEGALNIQALFMAQMQQTTALLTALVGRAPADPLQMLAGIKALLPPPAPPTNPLENIATAMDLMKNAQEMVPAGRGGGGGGKGMEDRFFSLLEAVAPTVANRLLTPAPVARETSRVAFNPPPPAPAAPGRDPFAPAPPVIEGVTAEPTDPSNLRTGEGEDDPVNLKKTALYAMLSPFITDLADKAKKGRDPLTYADLFLDEAEDRKLPTAELLEFFGNEKLVEELSARFAGVKENAAWFETFRGAVLEMLTAPPDGDTLSPDAPAAGPAENSDA